MLQTSLPLRIILLSSLWACSNPADTQPSAQDPSSSNDLSNDTESGGETGLEKGESGGDGGEGGGDAGDGGDGGGDDGDGDPPLDTDNESVDLGNDLILHNIDILATSYYEKAENACVLPTYMVLLPGNRDVFPKLYFDIPFEDGPVSGDYAVGQVVPSYSSKGTQGYRGVTLYIEDKTEEGDRIAYMAQSGNINLYIDEKNWTARVTLSDLLFYESDGPLIQKGVLYGGEFTVGIIVSCSVLTSVSDGSKLDPGCSWTQDSVPYEHEYCKALEALYPPDILY